MRDFQIRDEQKNAIIYGRSNWLIIDLDRRRPLRPHVVMEKLPLNEGIDAYPDGAAELPAMSGETGALKKTGERVAAYSDLDYNGHVNNARYVQWVQDIADPAMLCGAEKLHIDMNYLHEIKIGERIEFFTKTSDDKRIYDIEGRRDSQPVFRAHLALGI